MPAYQRCSGCSRRQLLNVVSSYRCAMNSGTVTQDVAIKPSNHRRSSLVGSETLDMLEKQVHRLNLHRPFSARPFGSPRTNDSFLKNFSGGHSQLRKMDDMKRDITPGLLTNFEAMRKRRCSAPDVFDKKQSLPPLAGKASGLTGGIVGVRPKTTRYVTRKKSPTGENALIVKVKNGQDRLRAVPSMSSLSTHSAPSTSERVKLPIRPRSGDSSIAVDKTLTVFERLSSPVKRPQTSYNYTQSKSDPNFLNRRGSTPLPGRVHSATTRRKSLPHDALKATLAKSTGTLSVTKSHTSNENGGNSNSEASSPKSSNHENGLPRREAQDRNGQGNEGNDDSDIDEETSGRIIQWLIGVENSSRIIPENIIAEDEESTETAIRIIYPGD